MWRESRFIAFASSPTRINSHGSEGSVCSADPHPSIPSPTGRGAWGKDLAAHQRAALARLPLPHWEKAFAARFPRSSHLSSPNGGGAGVRVCLVSTTSLDADLEAIPGSSDFGAQVVKRAAVVNHLGGDSQLGFDGRLSRQSRLSFFTAQPTPLD